MRASPSATSATAGVANGKKTQVGVLLAESLAEVPDAKVFS